ELAFAVLGIGYVGNRLAAVFDAIPGGAVRMIERPRAQFDPRMWGQRLAGGKINKDHLRREDVDRDREQRRRHHLAEYRLDARMRPQVPGPDADPVAAVIAGSEKRQPDDMVEMGVAVEQVEID